MASFTFTGMDCLVLKIEELDGDTNEPDTNMFILYDTEKEQYIIRGRRRWTPKVNACEYSFVCDDEDELAHFLQYVICKQNKINEILYNYDNLPADSNDITFEFLNNYEHSDYEISGYNNKTFKRTRILKNLRMLKNIYNIYGV
jgi:hypothetical protein